MMNIQTERTVIRDFCEKDAYDLYGILGDEEVMEFLEPAYDYEKTKAFLKSFCIERKGAFACEYMGRVIGYILFNEYEPGVYEMGWIFNKEYWGKGFAYEACSAVMDHGFAELGIHKIFAETIDEIKSVSLMQKLGMECEGIQKSHTRNNSGKWCDVYLYGKLNRKTK